MRKYPDQTRNLNPTAEAKLAMMIWGDEYGRSGIGSMDFWDALSNGRKNICRRGVVEIKKCIKAHPTTGKDG